MISALVSGVSYVRDKCLPTLSRAYGKRTSETNDMGVVVPSMSRTTQRCKPNRDKNQQFILNHMTITARYGKHPIFYELGASIISQLMIEDIVSRI